MIELLNDVTPLSEADAMISSNERKKALSKWLKDNNPSAFYSALKLQKFLFFYEAFCKALDQPFDFSKLQGFVNGPVFGTVYGDYVHEHDTFIRVIDQADIGMVDTRIAKMASFFVSCKTEKDLSDISHLFNIWKTKEPEILKREKTIVLNEKDFNDLDIEQAQLAMLFAEDYIDEDYRFINIENCVFLLDEATYKRLTPHHFDLLFEEAQLPQDEEGLINPIFVEIDEEDGGICFE